MRPGERPLDELRRVLVSGAADPLAEALDALPADGRLLLAVDQLEELFTACRSDDERAAFADALARAAADPQGRAVVVVALRADYYGRFAGYPAFAELLGANHVLVGSMQASELRRAVELPAGRVGLRVEPELVDALVDDVEAEPARCRCCRPPCSSSGRSGATTRWPSPPTGSPEGFTARRAAGGERV